MFLKLLMYNIFFAEVGYYEYHPQQLLDLWRGYPLLRRSGERMMRF